MSQSTDVPSVAGLSPRVRGNLLPGMHRHRSPGSIPACAGEPSNDHRAYARQAVYPRVCGGTLMFRVID